MGIQTFRNDYNQTAHPRVLNALKSIENRKYAGYGLDDACEEASYIIKGLIKNANAEVFFVSGGTQANLTVISSMLKPYESIISADTGHICTHEAGAIEATGHKICISPSENGKLNSEAILTTTSKHTSEHMVKPKAVYITNATEVGTIYTKEELSTISKICKQKNLFLYLDGARLGAALAARVSDCTLDFISSCVDIFTIGGTKNGALFGEAVVINNPAIQENFRFHMKQRGALLAKGFVLGTQFVELFKDGLFFELAAHANRMATLLAESLAKLGVEFSMQLETNQIFLSLRTNTIDTLKDKYASMVWEKKTENTSIVRLVTSWATTETDVQSLVDDFQKSI